MHVDSSFCLTYFFFLMLVIIHGTRDWQATSGSGANPACHLFLLIKFYWETTSLFIYAFSMTGESLHNASRAATETIIPAKPE